jgi:hypothetical protein
VEATEAVERSKQKQRSATPPQDIPRSLNLRDLQTMSPIENRTIERTPYTEQRTSFLSPKFDTTQQSKIKEEEYEKIWFSTLLEERITKEESMQFPTLFEPYVYNPKIRTNYLYLDKMLQYASRRDDSGNGIIAVLNDLDAACSQCNCEYVTAIQAIYKGNNILEDTQKELSNWTTYLQGAGITQYNRSRWKLLPDEDRLIRERALYQARRIKLAQRFVKKQDDATLETEMRLLRLEGGKLIHAETLMREMLKIWVTITPEYRASRKLSDEFIRAILNSSLTNGVKWRQEFIEKMRIAKSEALTTYGKTLTDIEALTEALTQIVDVEKSVAEQQWQQTRQMQLLTDRDQSISQFVGAEYSESESVTSVATKDLDERMEKLNTFGKNNHRKLQRHLLKLKKMPAATLHAIQHNDPQVASFNGALDAMLQDLIRHCEQQYLYEDATLASLNTGHYGPGGASTSGGAPMRQWPLICKICGVEGQHYKGGCPFAASRPEDGAPIGIISYKKIIEDVKSHKDASTRLHEIIGQMRKKGLYAPRWNPDKTIDYNQQAFDACYMYLTSQCGCYDKNGPAPP